MIDVNLLKKKVADYPYVSFDIFDTLVKRDVERPSDVFVLIQRKFEMGNPYELGDFRKRRMEAEKIARQKSKTPEVTLDDIYKELEKVYNSEIISKLKTFEIEIEQCVCTVNKPIHELFDFCKSEGKKILIISNMYLPQSIIETILSKNGYTEYEKLFLSCSVGLKKDKGALFKYVLEELKIKRTQIVHIGDSWKADFVSAKLAGISTIHISKDINNLSHQVLDKTIDEDFDSKCVRSFINNHINCTKSKYYQFGYESFGKLILSFCRWMYNDMKINGLQNVFFFSRDGFILKKAFDILYKNDCNIKSHYFYVSRRSLRVPQLWLNPEYDDILKTFPLAKLLTVGTFLGNIGLDCKDYARQMKKNDLYENKVLKKTELKNNLNLRNFYDEIKSDVIATSCKEYKLFEDYMQQNNFRGKIAVVDIGWHGSLQYFIQKMVDKTDLNLNMRGYYIGLTSEAKRSIDINGYVVDKNSLTDSCDSCKAYIGLVESLFLAQEGSTKRYEKGNDNIVIPVLFPYEYANEKGEKENEAIKVSEIQEGAIDFVCDFFQSGYEQLIKLSPLAAYSDINEIGLHPSFEDIQMFGDFRYLAEQVDYLAKTNSILHYIFHPKELKKDLAFSRWKVGFLKRLLKLPLPYVLFYKVLQKATS